MEDDFHLHVGVHKHKGDPPTLERNVRNALDNPLDPFNEVFVYCDGDSFLEWGSPLGSSGFEPDDYYHVVVQFTAPCDSEHRPSKEHYLKIVRDLLKADAISWEASCNESTHYNYCVSDPEDWAEQYGWGDCTVVQHVIH